MGSYWWRQPRRVSAGPCGSSCTSVLANLQQSFKSCYPADRTSCFLTIALTCFVPVRPSRHFIFLAQILNDTLCMKLPSAIRLRSAQWLSPGDRGKSSTERILLYTFSAWLPGVTQVIRDNSAAWLWDSGFQEMHRTACYGFINLKSPFPVYS